MQYIPSAVYLEMDIFCHLYYTIIYSYSSRYFKVLSFAEGLVQFLRKLSLKQVKSIARILYSDRTHLILTQPHIFPLTTKIHFMHIAIVVKNILQQYC